MAAIAKKIEIFAAEDSKKAKPEILKNTEADEDEFEEFETLNTDALAASTNDSANQDNINVWEDNWDDECAETDFSKQLKEELAKQGHKSAQ